MAATDPRLIKSKAESPIRDRESSNSYVDRDTQEAEGRVAAASAIESAESGRIPARKVGPVMNERERALERHKAQRDDLLKIMKDVRRLRAMPPVKPTTADEWREYII